MRPRLSKSYATKHIVLSANATAPSVLLLNDKFDPQWSVTVDGQPAELLRCNFLMRGVYLPPSAYETAFLSTAHEGPALDLACQIMTEAIAAL